jgi:exosome complex RNA-binding protein Rrp4
MKSQQTVSSGEVKVADVKGVRATREVALTAVLSGCADLREGILVETQ